MIGKHACNIWEMPNALNNRSSPPPPSLIWLRAPSVFFLSPPTNLQTNHHLVHVAFIHLGGGGGGEFTTNKYQNANSNRLFISWFT